MEEYATSLRKCLICKTGDIIRKNRKDEKEGFMVYGRNGSRAAVHVESRCNFSNANFECGTGYFHGYMTYKGMKIVHDDVLNNSVLVTSCQTAFDMDYLVELIGRVQISSTTFEGAAKEFNRFFNQNLPYDVIDMRVEVVRKRIAEAYYLYTYLEYCQRYQIADYQIIKNNIDDSILDKKVEMLTAYRERWTVRHNCDRPGCQVALVIDGGLKPHRSICGAKTCGIREFQEAGVKIMTGCPTIPQPKSKFCFDHQDGQHPVVQGDRLGAKNRKKLKKFKRAECVEAEDDDFFIIEAVLDIKENKKTGKKYKIKWMDFPNEEATWESEACVAKFIQMYYSDPSKLGSKLPDPVIKHSKTIGNSKYHYLGWSGEKGGRWLGEDFFTVASEDGGIMSTIKSACDTRKSRDKRVKAASLGLLIGAYPCGIVPLFDELYNSEGIAQVHGILTEYLATVSEKEKLEYIIYDDACHLVKYSQNEKVSERSKTTKFLSERKFVIDRFHFRNHIDPYCHENCDPNEVPELRGMNSEICEQLFRGINEKKNCKGMNEPHFFLFWLYNLDMHNLEMSRMDRTEPNPLSEFRWSQIKVLPVDYENLPSKFGDKPPVDSLVSDLEGLSLSSLPFNCELCPAGYKNKGQLTKHTNAKHKVEAVAKVSECQELCGDIPCGKVLSSTKSLDKHIKSVHRSCNVCNDVFDSHNAKANHMLVHTFCYECDKNFMFESKLTRHKKQKHDV